MSKTWRSRNNDPTQTNREDGFDDRSARRAAVKNRLCGDFVQSKLLRLQVGAVFVKARDDGENHSGSKHQPGEESKVLISTDFLTAAQDKFIDQRDESFP